MTELKNTLLAKDPFFIVGTGRCGTQMLRDMLRKSKKIEIAPETHFIPILYKKYGLGEINYDDYFNTIDNVHSSRGYKWIKLILKLTNKPYETFYTSFKKYTMNLVKNQNIKQYTEAFYLYLYGNVYRIGDKTPSYGVYATTIKKIWPRSKFIFLIRDGVDTSESMTNHKAFIKNINAGLDPEDISLSKYMGKNVNFPEKTVSLESAIKYWQKVTLKTIKELSKLPEKDSLRIRYEDLLTSPKVEMEKISKFLSIPNSNNWVAQASEIPYPFPERKCVNKLPENKYRKLAKLAKKGMDMTGYPYEISVERGLLDTLREVYRGRKYYLKKIIKLDDMLNIYHKSGFVRETISQLKNSITN